MCIWDRVTDRYQQFQGIVGKTQALSQSQFLGALRSVSRSLAWIVFSTQISATFVEADEDLLAPDEPNNVEDMGFALSSSNIAARKLFKLLNSELIIMGKERYVLYSARRVTSGC